MVHHRSAVHEIPEARRPVQLGEHAFIWRAGRTVPNSRLLISSHGIYMPRPDFTEWREGEDGWLHAPTELVFYAPHGSSLLDPGTGPVMQGRVDAYETVPSGGRVRNYRLSKYQTRDRENYRTIDYGAGHEEDWDILTIRNRAWRLTITLRDVLDLLREHNYAYPSIHCAFCRARILFAPSHDARRVEAEPAGD